ncbi:MAG: ribosome small subunit-dependent GTPase A [Methanospirillaceae archaeon]|nr:ribosome small subunit-dependent GTPase A [Methanospirillaceae archaeon]
MSVPGNSPDNRVRTLSDLGWDEDLTKSFSRYTCPYVAGRVAAAQRTVYDVMLPGRSVLVPVSGALQKIRSFPVVGDFVVLLDDNATGPDMIVAILPRKTALSRGGAGEKKGEQILAANIDYAFIVTDCGPDFSLARLERYLMIVFASGARPVIIINKTDLSDDLSIISEATAELGPDIPVVFTSAVKATGPALLEPYLQPGKTVVCIGSSGVGKSTLINAMAGRDLQKTSGIREDDGKGRHTTTVRELFYLPSGAVIIDTPGLREIRIWTAKESLPDVFDDILKLAQGCRFSDCGHKTEPGCAVLQAVAQSELSEERLKRYHKIQKELAFESDKAEIGLKRFEKKRWKGIAGFSKEIQEYRRH